MEEQISYFQGWSDHDFAIWLAAFIDGEGCIFFSKGRPGVDISIANTNRDVIMSIYMRLGFGYVDEVQFDRAEWKTKFNWRVRDYQNVRRVLVMILPYLTFKRDKAIAALQKIAHLSVKESKHVEFMDRIGELQEEGMTQEQIATELGCSRSNISLALNPCLPRARGGGPKRPGHGVAKTELIKVKTICRRLHIGEDSRK